MWLGYIHNTYNITKSTSNQLYIRSLITSSLNNNKPSTINKTRLAVKKKNPTFIFTLLLDDMSIMDWNWIESNCLFLQHISDMQTSSKRLYHFTVDMKWWWNNCKARQNGVETSVMECYNSWVKLYKNEFRKWNAKRSEMRWSSNALCESN